MYNVTLPAVLIIIEFLMKIYGIISKKYGLYNKLGEYIKMSFVYLDNSATTKPCKQSIDVLNQTLIEDWGNPSSLHTLGIKAEKMMNEARQKTAKLMGCMEKEVYFTSGGTEANNIAIQGAAKARKRLGNKIITTEIEHASVYETVKNLEKEGFEIVTLKPQNGEITARMFEDAIDKNTILVSMMMVNNETGAYLPIQAIKKIIQKKEAPALFHCDAVQAFGKMEIKPNRLGIDLMTVSGHKIHAPKGIGALYISKDARVLPLYGGGEQEKHIRPGTESVPLICALGAACEAVGNIKEHFNNVLALKNKLVEMLSGIDEVVINSPDNALPYVFNISVMGIKSETMLHYLASNNVYVSSGSACSKGKKSRTLQQLGFPDEKVDTALRISFCRDNTMEDIEIFVKALKCGINSLQRIKK